MKPSKRLAILAIVALVAIVTPLSARLGGAGSSASFLTMGAGARPIAMGCAYTALAEGPDALFWNPAGILRVETPTATFGQAILFAGMLEENLAGTMSFGPANENALGMQLLAHLSGPIEVTTFEDQDGTGNYYTANNFAVGLSYARRMTDKFAAGFTFKVVDLTLDKVSALGFAVDVGATYTIDTIFGTKRNLRLGFAIQNFGPDMAYSGDPLFFNTHKDTLQTDDIPSNYESESFPLPFTFAGGAAIDLIPPDTLGGSRLTLAADFSHIGDQYPKGALGVEYALNEMFFLRGGLGLNTSPDLGESPDAMTIIREVFSNRNSRGPSAGMGIKWPLKGKVLDQEATDRAREIDPTAAPLYKDKIYNLIVDYGFEWHWYLNPVHRASLAVTF